MFQRSNKEASEDDKETLSQIKELRKTSFLPKSSNWKGATSFLPSRPLCRIMQCTVEFLLYVWTTSVLVVLQVFPSVSNSWWSPPTQQFEEAGKVVSLTTRQLRVGHGQKDKQHAGSMGERVPSCGAFVLGQTAKPTMVTQEGSLTVTGHGAPRAHEVN